MTVKLLWWSHVLWTELHWFIHQNKWAAETGGAALRRCWRQTQAGAKINFHFYFQRGSWRGPGDKAVTRTRHSPCKKEKQRWRIHGSWGHYRRHSGPPQKTDFWPLWSSEFRKLTINVITLIQLLFLLIKAAFRSLFYNHSNILGLLFCCKVGHLFTAGASGGH